MTTMNSSPGVAERRCLASRIVVLFEFVKGKIVPSDP